VMAANFVWPSRSMVGEKLLLVIHLEPGQRLTEELRKEIAARNNRLINYKRAHGLVVYDEDFPLTASMKVKRNVLAERLANLDRDQAIQPI
jgi:acyl-coenzyme A synthetase/AMP-(fatty) acid ligase